MRNGHGLSLILVALLILSVTSCSDGSAEKPVFRFNPPMANKVVAKVKGIEITEEELMRGIESEVYEAEKRVFEVKFNRLQAIVLQKLLETHPDKKNLSNDEFLNKYIYKDGKVSEKEIQEFVKERKIPKDHLNEQMKQRIVQFLENEKKKQAVEKWLAKQTQKHPVDVFMLKPEPPTFEVKVGDAPVWGNKNAPVTIVEFSDFQCPYCSKATETISQIKKKYGSKVRVAFKNFPLPFHNHAMMAAEAGLCAHEQSSDKFWKLHDAMFADQSGLDKSGLVAKAKKIGLNMDKFTQCLDSHKFRSRIEQDKKEGMEVSVQSTPTFYVNGKLISGAQPLEVFVELIDSELGK